MQRVLMSIKVHAAQRSGNGIRGDDTHLKTQHFEGETEAGEVS